MTEEHAGLTPMPVGKLPDASSRNERASSQARQPVNQFVSVPKDDELRHQVEN
jgi:hypothetical protein